LLIALDIAHKSAVFIQHIFFIFFIAHQPSPYMSGMIFSAPLQSVSKQETVTVTVCTHQSPRTVHTTTSSYPCTWRQATLAPVATFSCAVV